MANRYSFTVNVALSQDSNMVERFAVSQKLVDRFNVRLPPILNCTLFLVGWRISAEIYLWVFFIKNVFSSKKSWPKKSNGMKCINKNILNYRLRMKLDTFIYVKFFNNFFCLNKFYELSSITNIVNGWIEYKELNYIFDIYLKF